MNNYQLKYHEESKRKIKTANAESSYCEVKKEQIQVSPDRRLCRILLYLIKIIPVFASLVYYINSILIVLNINIPILSYLTGMSLLPLFFFYIASITFRFCLWHRLFIYYIFISDIISIFDYYIGIPMNAVEMIIFATLIFCVFAFLITWTYVRSHKEIVVEDHRQH